MNNKRAYNYSKNTYQKRWQEEDDILGDDIEEEEETDDIDRLEKLLEELLKECQKLNSHIAQMNLQK